STPPPSMLRSPPRCAPSPSQAPLPTTAITAPARTGWQTSPHACTAFRPAASPPPPPDTAPSATATPDTAAPAPRTDPPPPGTPARSHTTRAPYPDTAPPAP